MSPWPPGQLLDLYSEEASIFAGADKTAERSLHPYGTAGLERQLGFRCSSPVGTVPGMVRQREGGHNPEHI